MAKKTVKKKTARKANAAFMRPVTPSPALAEVVGTKPIPRTEVTKKLWAYIKKNGLQDKKNRRMINADTASEDGLWRQGVGEHVRDDEAGREALEVEAALAAIHVTAPGGLGAVTFLWHQPLNA